MLIQLNTDNHVDGRHGARDKLVRVLDKRLAKLRPPKGIDPYERPAVDQGASL